MTRRYDLSGYLIFQLIGGLVLFTMFWALMNATAVGFFDVAIEQGNADRAQGAAWLKMVWTFGPAIVLTMLSLGLLNRAVFESRGGVA